MGYFLLVEERTLLCQEFDHLGVRLPDGKALEIADLIREPALFVERGHDGKFVSQSRIVIVFAVSRRRMNTAGAVSDGDMVRQDDQGVPSVERIGTDDPFKFPAGERPKDGSLHAAFFQHRPGQRFGKDERSRGRFHQRVRHIGMESDRHVGRQCPGRRRPYHEECRAAETFLEFLFYGKGDEDGRRRIVLVFNLRFGKGGFANEAPVDRLECPIDKPVKGEIGECPDDCRFIRWVERQVGVFPFAEDAEPFEFLLLDFLEFQGVRGGLFPEFPLINAVLVGFDFLKNLMLDRHAVAVPSRYIRRPEAGERLVLDDNVLQYLVERRADMDMAVGIRRPVMQNKKGTCFVLFEYFMIQVLFFPTAEKFRFPLAQICLHREIGGRKQDGRGIITHESSFVTMKTMV